jgi:hypothetical protein
MTASYDDISSWFDVGLKRGSTHMLIICDRFSYENYPVYVDLGDDPEDAHDMYQHKLEMTSVDEIYDLRMDKAVQMEEERAFHLP